MAESGKKWYVMRAVSGKEGKVKEYIELLIAQHPDIARHVSQVLIPTEKVLAVRNGKRVVKEKNRYSGYVFVEAEFVGETQASLRSVPNVLGFLSYGKSSKKPEPVSQTEINKIVGNVDETELNTQMEETFLVGEKVKVVDGPFNGFNGVVQEVLQEKHKLKVVVTIFDRQTPLELGFNQVDKE